MLVVLTLPSVLATGAVAHNSSTMAQALIADGPAPSIASLDCPYAWLVGRWNVRVIDHVDGKRVESSGEWHFAWVLEGRAIQDVWIAPARDDRADLAPDRPNRYGSTLRSYDPKRRQWRAVWTNPVSGAFDILWARRSGADLIQEGLDSEGNSMRWVFTDITADSARWYGERSRDGGKNWVLEAEFFLRRAD